MAQATGCSAGAGYTLVEKRVRPGHFKFVPVVKHGEPGAGGWRAACLYLRLAHEEGRAFMCRVGIAVPMETGSRVDPACRPEAAAVTSP